MRWSWTIARFRGINVDLHATFLLLVAWIAFASYASSRTAAGALGGVFFTVAVFASVVLHEFGHALMAARFGVKTRSITLLPIGGIAHLERLPDRPKQELAIAIAGPLVTLLIVAVLWLGLRLTGTPTISAATAPMTPASFVARVMWINVVLLGFNLLPAFPMDGGRVLRAALAMRMPFARATEIAAQVGKMFALVFGLAGLLLLNNPLLVVVAIFVWLGAASEAAAARVKATVSDVSVERAMITDVRTLDPAEPVSAAIAEVRSGFQHDFPVVKDHAVAGILTRERLLKAITDGRANETVGDIMERDFSTTTPDESLYSALERLQTCSCRTLPVLRGRALVGLLTVEKISDFILFASARRAAVAK